MLSRKKGERIIINGNIVLEVEEIKGNTVVFRFDSPKTTSILREEIITKARLENGKNV